MLFAAGFGTRMGALTAHVPKPLIAVGGKRLINHALALADAAKITDIVVNLHYLGKQIEDYLQDQRVRFSWERDIILETGGGLRAALPLLGDGPVITLNTDAVWTNPAALTQLMAGWEDSTMDALVLVLPAHLATGHNGNGDFVMAADGKISRANGAAGLVYLGAQILKTDRLADIATPVFSLNLIWDQMIADGRLYGLIYDGGWCDVGSPEGLAQAETLLAMTAASGNV